MTSRAGPGPGMGLATALLAVLSATLLAAVFLGVLAAAPAASAYDDKPRLVFTIDSSEVAESSALVVSTVHPDLVYTANDSGDAATVYVLEADSGKLVGQTTISGIAPVDIEGLAGGSDGSLVLADIGDNDNDNPSVAIYRIDQPGRGSQSVTANPVTLTYSDGPRDAESVLYDPESGRVFVASKEFEGAHIYGTPQDVFDRSTATLKPVSGAPGLATDATFLPDGDIAVIRTYFDAIAYRYPGWERIRTISLPRQDQGESVAAPPGGDEIWVGSEGEHSKVLAVRMPDLTPDPPITSPTSPAPPTQTEESAHREELKGAARVVIVGSVGLLCLVVLIGALRYRRHHRASP